MSITRPNSQKSTYLEEERRSIKKKPGRKKKKGTDENMISPGDFEVDEDIAKRKTAHGPQYADLGNEYYEEAVRLVISEKRASTSFIQRYFKIGYNRAANIIEKMEQNQIISEADKLGRREVLK